DHEHCPQDARSQFLFNDFIRRSMSSVNPCTLQNESTIACVLTPGGRGAVAVIGIRGDLSVLDMLFKSVNSIEASSQRLNRICFGHWGQSDAGEIGPEEIIFVRTSSR